MVSSVSFSISFGLIFSAGLVSDGACSLLSLPSLLSFPPPNEKLSSFFQLLFCFSLNTFRSASPSVMRLAPIAAKSSSGVWKLCKFVSLSKEDSSIRMPSACKKADNMVSPTFWLALSSLRKMEAILAREVVAKFNHSG